MKLEEVVTETLCDNDDCHVYAVISEHNKSLDLFIKAKDGGNVKTTAKHITDNPTVAAAAYRYATDALMSYKRAKRYTTRFVATDGEEREFYQKMVKDLLSTGRYKLIRKRTVGANIIWEVRLKK